MISVFTPTYNRGYIIDKLYNSLLEQTDKDFEWIVIDDGSSDGTEEYFEKIIKNDNPFPIYYQKVQNGGKHRAINKGVSLAKGEMFFIVDSDDCLLPFAIENIKKWFSTLDDSKKWAGVSGLRGHSETQVLGGANKSEYVDAKNTEREKYHLLGDKAEIYFTSVLRQYPFPEIEGENFLTEEVVWNRIAVDGYYIRWFNEIIYICNYLEDGLTKNSTKAESNPKGMLIWAKGQLVAFPNDFKMRLTAIYIYYAAVKGTKKIKQIAKDLDQSSFKVYLSIIVRNIKHLLVR